MDQIELIIINVLLTSLLLYLALNTYFHFHVSALRTNVFSMVLTVFTLILMIDTFVLQEGIYALLLILAFKFILDQIGIKQKTKGYLLLNVGNKNYAFTKAFFVREMRELDISESHLYYSSQKPFLIVFRDVAGKDVKKMVGRFDKAFQKNLKSFSPIHYLSFIISVLIIILIWRF